MNFNLNSCLNLFHKTLISIRICLLFTCACLAVSCEDLTVYGGKSAGSSQFTGLSEVRVTDEGHLLLTWTAANGKSDHTYRVSYRKVAELPENLSETTLTEQAPLRSSALDLDKEDTTLGLEELIAIKNESSYTFDQALDLGSYYIFQVSEAKSKISKRRLFIVRVDLAPPIALRILSSAAGMGVLWDRVPGASSYQITGLPDTKTSVGEPSYIINPYDPQLDYDLCIAARYGTLSSKTCTKVNIPANLSRVKAVSVTSSVANGIYASGSIIPMVVKFSGKVSLAEGATLALLVKHGTSESLVPYSSGSSTDTFTFTYTVENGQNAAAIDALSLFSQDNAKALLDEAGRPILYSLPSSTSAMSLAEQKQIQIDTQAPGPPSAVVFSSPFSATLAFGVSWTAGSDVNLDGYKSKICVDSACSASCRSEGVVSPDLMATKTGVDGASYYACVQAVDKAGNLSAWTASATRVTVDTSAPVITSVTSAMADGIFRAGSIIPIQVVFSGNVFVTNGNDLTLTLETGTTDTNAVYISGTGTNTLIFNYTIQPGDTAADLNYVSTGAFSLGATGVIKGASGVGVSLTLPGLADAGALSVLKNFKIDTSPPAAPSSVGFASPLNASTNIVMSWADSIDTPNNFRYHNVKLCATNDCSTSCIGLTTDPASPVTISGIDGSTYYGCVQGEDFAGNVTAWVPSIGTVKVDTSLPTVTHISSPTADGYYKINASIPIDVTFSENVYVTSDSDLALAMSSGSSAVFLTGSGTSKLRFIYTVQAGDTSIDLNVASAGALTLVGAGAIQDSAGNNATLTLPPAELSTSKAIVIDTTLPVAPSSVGFASAKSSSLTFPTTWIDATDTNFKQHNVMLCAASNCTSSCISNVVQGTSPATLTGLETGIYYSCVQGEDKAGNVSAWVSSAATLTVDTIAPTVTDVSSSSADGSYKTGDRVDLTVEFSKAVYVVGSEGLLLLLETGTPDRTATYLAGSGTTTLSFKYIVQANDVAADLNAQSVSALSEATGTTVKDDVGNSAVLTLPDISGLKSIASHKNIVIDATAPTSPVSPGFSGATSTTLTFNMSWGASADTHTVTYNTKICAANDCSSSCISAGTSVILSKTMTGVNPGIYYGCVQAQDESGNTSAWVSTIGTLTVDTSVPTITNVTSPAPNGYYKAGAVIPITLTFSENVYVTNEVNFRLSLETGASDTQAVYASGNSSNILVFNYTVAATDNSADLDPILTTPLTLGASATIQDAAGNNANITLPTGGSSIAGQKALVIDTTPPSVPSAITFPNSYSLTPSFLMSWSTGTDANFRYSDVRLCTDVGCSLGCVSPNTSLASPASVTGVVGGIYYGCVQSRDLADNVSGYAASASTITVETLPTFAGVASGEVLGSWADGTGKLELTFAGTPAATLQKYQIFYSASATYGSFDLSSPIATINYGDATFDAIPTDTKLLVSIPTASLKDGYYYVRYFDINGKYVDPNRSISTIVYVLKGTPGYVLVPKKFSSFSYDYYIMRYEASLSSTGTLSSDSVTTTEASLASCSYKFHIDGTAADASCGTKNTTKSAESVSGTTPQASVTWSNAFFACRNASGSNAKVRLPTADEWRRASQWIGTSYSSMWTTYSGNTGGNCNVTSGSAGTTGSATLCKSTLGLQDMAGNLSEWVDNRMLQYSISSATESRFSFGPTIGRTLPNGIDNIIRRFHTLDPGAGGLAMTLGANFKTPTFADQKQYGTDVQTWTDPATTDTGIGFRCLGFRADSLPTMSQLALPDEPKFVTADLATVGLVPENFYVRDNRWEQVAITIDGTTTDAVAEGSVNVTWQPWSKTTCNTSGICATSDSSLIYKLYRFTEPNHQSIRMATPWALGNTGSNYTADKPVDPLAVDSSGNRLFTSSTSDGTLIATISNCAAATTANCTFADLSAKDGGSLVVSKIYNYILVVEDATGNAVIPSVQRYRSPYFAGPALNSASAFRMEPRLRRASVFLTDEYHQQNQTRPQIMVHIPMDKSGLDRDFFIQKYEASQYGATGLTNNSPSGASDWPLQGTAAAWVKNAALCQDQLLQLGTFNQTGCGNGSAISTSALTVQSMQGTSPINNIDQGAASKACSYTTIADSDGKSYSLHLVTDSEFIKAADWGDTNFDGTIEASVNPFTGSVAITSLEGGSGDSTTVRCHTDSNPASIFASNSSGAGSTSNCRSRYGVADIVGNQFEWTSGRISTAAGEDNGSDGLWLGRSFFTTNNVAFATLGSSNYDLVRGYPTASGTGSVVYDAGDYYFYGSSIKGARRGGQNGNNGKAGRWMIDFASAPSGGSGLRCSL